MRLLAQQHQGRNLRKHALRPPPWIHATPLSLHGGNLSILKSRETLGVPGWRYTRRLSVSMLEGHTVLGEAVDSLFPRFQSEGSVQDLCTWKGGYKTYAIAV